MYLILYKKTLLEFTMIIKKEKSEIKKLVVSSSFFSKQGLYERFFSLLFNNLTYTFVCEDPAVDYEALKLTKDSKVLMISSAGCNVLNYLKENPAHITAVDINGPHLSLTNLRLAAINHLPSYKEFYDFFGKANCSKNIKNYYQFIEPFLDFKTKKFWSNSKGFRARTFGQRIRYFKKGLYHFGWAAKGVKLLFFFMKIYNIKLSNVLESDNLKQQNEYFQNKIVPAFKKKSVRFIAMLFSPFFYSSFGVPPEQIKKHNINVKNSFSDLGKLVIFRNLCLFSVDKNYFSWIAISFSYNHKKKIIPDYLKEEYYKKIKNNIDRVKTVQISVQDYLKQQKPGAFNRFNFLDALDWMSKEQQQELWREIDRVAPSGSRIIFRSALRITPLETILPSDILNKFNFEKKESERLLKLERTGLYDGFYLYVKK